METTIVYSGYIGTMETNMETTIVYSGYIEILEKKTETTIVYSGLYWDNGEENGNYYSILGLQSPQNIGTLTLELGCRASCEHRKRSLAWIC